MANNTKIISALEKVINIFEKLKFNDHLNELSTLYRNNKNNAGGKTKFFKDLCKKDDWKKFSSAEISFLESFGVYPYMGENSYIMCTELISDNYNSPTEIGNTLFKHWNESIKAFESCKRLLKALNDGHFTESTNFNLESYLEKADLDIALKGVDSILATLKERLDLTEAEITELKERMEELKEDLKNKKPSRWKKLAEFSVHTAIAECIKDPTKVMQALELLGLFQKSAIKALPMAEQLTNV